MIAVMVFSPDLPPFWGPPNSRRVPMVTLHSKVTDYKPRINRLQEASAAGLEGLRRGDRGWDGLPQGGSATGRFGAAVGETGLRRPIGRESRAGRSGR